MARLPAEPGADDRSEYDSPGRDEPPGLLAEAAFELGFKARFELIDPGGQLSESLVDLRIESAGSLFEPRIELGGSLLQLGIESGEIEFVQFPKVRPVSSIHSIQPSGTRGRRFH